jgi:hypothetical protein
VCQGETSLPNPLCEWEGDFVNSLIAREHPMFGKPKVDINLGKKVEVTEEKDFSINVPQQFARTYTAVVFETDDPPME